jgi:hypothetical protein
VTEPGGCTRLQAVERPRARPPGGGAVLRRVHIDVPRRRGGAATAVRSRLPPGLRRPAGGWRAAGKRARSATCTSAAWVCSTISTSSARTSSSSSLPSLSPVCSRIGISVELAGFLRFVAISFLLICSRSKGINFLDERT